MISLISRLICPPLPCPLLLRPLPALCRPPPRPSPLPRPSSPLSSSLLSCCLLRSADGVVVVVALRFSLSQTLPIHSVSVFNGILRTFPLSWPSLPNPPPLPFFFFFHFPPNLQGHPPPSHSLYQHSSLNFLKINFQRLARKFEEDGGGERNGDGKWKSAKRRGEEGEEGKGQGRMSLSGLRPSQGPLFHYYAPR